MGLRRCDVASRRAEKVAMPTGKDKSMSACYVADENVTTGKTRREFVIGIGKL